MRKIILFIPLILLIFVSCHKTDKDKGLIISSVKISGNAECYLDSFNTYSIEIKLKNIGVDTIRFWSMTCGKTLNFLFKRDDIYFYDECIRSKPIEITLVPEQEYILDGCMATKKRLNQMEMRKIYIGFKLFDTRKFTELDYIHGIFTENNDASLTNANSRKNYPDTVWYNKKIKFAEKIN